MDRVVRLARSARGDEVSPFVYIVGLGACVLLLILIIAGNNTKDR